MRKKPKIPKINMVIFKYNSDQNTFEKFLSNMATNYFNSDIMPEYMSYNLGDLVEIPPDQSLPLDK